VWRSKALLAGSPWRPLRARAIVTGQARQIAELLYDRDRMTDYDEMLSGSTLLHTLDADADDWVRSTSTSTATNIKHIVYKAVWPTKARDFCCLTTMECDPDGSSAVVASRSIDPYEDCPPRPPAVRGTVLISGYYIEQLGGNDSGSCELTMLIHTELGGQLPPALINRFSTSAPVKLMRKVQAIANREF
jgi:hypothetical protein